MDSEGLSGPSVHVHFPRAQFWVALAEDVRLVDDFKIPFKWIQNQTPHPPTQAHPNLQQLSMEDTNNVLMRFCPEVNRKWNMSLWDLIELQMKVRVERKGLELPPEQPGLDQLNSSTVPREPQKSKSAPPKKKKEKKRKTTEHQVQQTRIKRVHSVWEDTVAAVKQIYLLLKTMSWTCI